MESAWTWRNNESWTQNANWSEDVSGFSKPRITYAVNWGCSTWVGARHHFSYNAYEVCLYKERSLTHRREKKSLKKTFVNVKSHVVCGCKL